MVEQNKNLFHNFCDYKTNYLKKFPQSFQKSYRSFHVARPSTPFTIGIPSALNRRLMHLQVVCNICGWQSHRKSANIDQGQGECIYILAIFWNCKMVFRFWTFHAGFKITLCGPILIYGKTKQYAIWQLELQNWAAKRNFVQSKRKRWKKKTPKKNSNGLAEKALPCGNGSYNFEKDTK